MTAPDLWPYQRDVIARIENEIVAGRRRICVVAPTGSGKTVIAADLTAKAVARDEPVLFFAHRRELTDQTSQKLHTIGVQHGIIQAGFPTRPAARVQVGSIQTLDARALRTCRMNLPPADLVIIDEAHHSRARTYMRLLAAYPSAIILGLTATPCRSDGRGLGNIFEVLVECPSVADLTTAGYLVRARIFAPVRPDLSGIKIVRGDYVESQLADRMNTARLVGDIVEHWHRLGEGRRTVVFTVSVAHSVHVRNEFRRSGVLAEHIDGSTPIEERKAILARFAAGKVDLVCNCAVLTEGWDRPEASCLVLARPTRSLGLYRQMVGRILRPAQGKTDALILDHSGTVFVHGFPDDEISWTLHEDRRAENISHTKREAELHVPALTVCPECYAVRLEGKPCGQCGWHPVRKATPIEIADGELGEIDRDHSIRFPSQDAFKFYRELLWILAEKHRRNPTIKNGWAAAKFREKTGRWPPFVWRTAEPLPPSPATRAWVRSRDIAYARARQARP
jgi:superfamily II DNA or RNA helicase